PSLVQARPSLAAAQGGIFLANANFKDNGVEERENHGKGHETKGERKDKDFSGHDPIVGMAQKTVGAGGDQWRAGDNNNACGPSLAKARQHPQPGGLQQREKQQERRVWSPGGRQNPQTQEPPRVQNNHW